MRRAVPVAAGTTMLALACAFALLPAIARAASADVAALQVALRSAGLYTGAVDGISGPGTTSGLRRFQARSGLPADGVAGPRTRAALGARGRPLLGARPMVSGARGWDVAALQYLLRARGYDPGHIDGGFGPQTLTAVRAFQRTVGLPSDDVAGPRTIAGLRSGAVAARITDPVRFLRPVGGPWTDGFGWLGNRRHTGLDFPRGAGAPVGAAGRGTVSFAGANAFGYGNLVVVTHRLGFESWYAHLATITVRPGQAVGGGTALGTVGSTGHASGPHLHFEVRRFGTPIDPVPRLLAATAATSAPRTSRSQRPAAVRRRLICRPAADARHTRDTDPLRARPGRCP